MKGLNDLFKAPVQQVSADPVTRWRVEVMKEVQTIRSRLGWILFFIVSTVVLQLLVGIVSGGR